MNVATNLFEYLKRNDRAELVGFGTFLVTTHSAEFDAECNILVPPKRVLSFSKEAANDMSFVNFMAKREFISNQTALTWIKQYSDSLNERLASAKRLSLPSLGAISVDETGDYCFEPLPHLNLMDESFGLAAVKNVKTFEIPKQEVEAAQEAETPYIEETINEVGQTITEAKEQPVYHTIVSELATEEDEAEDIEQLVEEIRTKVDKILYLAQKSKEQQEDNAVAGGKRKHRSMWKWLFILIFIFLIGSFATVGSYYMGWLQSYKWAKPISSTLSQYIMTKDEVNHKFDTPKPIATATPTTSPADSTINNITLEQPPAPIAQVPTAKPRIARKKVAKHDTINKEENKPASDFSGIIQMRPTNKLGYDVIANTVEGRMKAENDARKAKTLGYDGYVIARQRKEVPIYYVSYGSRPTLDEAKDLMQSMIDKLGGSYYIVVRGETTN
ncbi:MAG: hypothetical protein LBO06_00350 [Bacteroidales bacterium]|jgi:nucleoid DNA-binding protein/nitrate reductase NapE component|nr:hypothetical protein [Bacteroidales bacterium]